MSFLGKIFFRDDASNKLPPTDQGGSAQMAETTRVSEENNQSFDIICETSGIMPTGYFGTPMTEEIISALVPHPLAKLYREATDFELQSLVESIRTAGLHLPIAVNPNGQILDGRHRLRACQMAGVEPRFVVFTGSDADAAEFVHAQNVARRHLTASDRALAVARTAASHSDAELLAIRAGCSPALASNALTLIRHGDRQLIELIEAGEVTIMRAYRVAVGKLKPSALFEDKRRKDGKKALKLVAGTDTTERASA